MELISIIFNFFTIVCGVLLVVGVFFTYLFVFFDWLGSLLRG